MKANKNNITNFPRNPEVKNKALTGSSTYPISDIIYLSDDDGGGNMSYITREEFNAKMEVIDIKFDKLEDKIDSTAELILSETKNYIHESNKEHTRWIIGAITVPIILFILDKLI